MRTQQETHTPITAEIRQNPFFSCGLVNYFDQRSADREMAEIKNAEGVIIEEETDHLIVFEVLKGAKQPNIPVKLMGCNEYRESSTYVWYKDCGLIDLINQHIEETAMLYRRSLVRKAMVIFCRETGEIRGEIKPSETEDRWVVTINGGYTHSYRTKWPETAYRKHFMSPVKNRKMYKVGYSPDFNHWINNNIINNFLQGVSEWD